MRALVVAEPGNDPTLVKEWKKGVFFAEYGEIFVDKVKEVLGFSPERKKIARAKSSVTKEKGG